MDDLGNIDGTVEAVQSGPDTSGNGPTADTGVGYGGNAEQGAEANGGGWGGGIVSNGGGNTVDLSAAGVVISSDAMQFTGYDAQVLGGLAATVALATYRGGAGYGALVAAVIIENSAIVGGPTSTAISHLEHDFGVSVNIMGQAIANGTIANPSINLFDSTTANQAGVTLAGSWDGSQVSVWDQSQDVAVTLNLGAGAAVNVQPYYVASGGSTSEAGGL